MGFIILGQSGLEILTSGDPPTSASQDAGIIGASYHAWPETWVPIQAPLLISCLWVNELVSSMNLLLPL